MNRGGARANEAPVLRAMIAVSITAVVAVACDRVLSMAELAPPEEWVPRGAGQIVTVAVAVLLCAVTAVWAFRVFVRALRDAPGWRWILVIAGPSLAALPVIVVWAALSLGLPSDAEMPALPRWRDALSLILVFGTIVGACVSWSLLAVFLVLRALAEQRDMRQRAEAVVAEADGLWDGLGHDAAPDRSDSTAAGSLIVDIDELRSRLADRRTWATGADAVALRTALAGTCARLSRTARGLGQIALAGRLDDLTRHLTAEAGQRSTW